MPLPACTGLEEAGKVMFASVFPVNTHNCKHSARHGAACHADPYAWHQYSAPKPRGPWDGETCCSGAQAKNLPKHVRLLCFLHFFNSPFGILPPSLLSAGTNSFRPHQLNRSFDKLSKITPWFSFALNALFSPFLCDFAWCFQFTRKASGSCSGCCACCSGHFASPTLWKLYSDFGELTFLSASHLKEESSRILK